jgi:hypothetical protein
MPLVFERLSLKGIRSISSALDRKGGKGRTGSEDTQLIMHDEIKSPKAESTRVYHILR